MILNPTPAVFRSMVDPTLDIHVYNTHINDLFSADVYVGPLSTYIELVANTTTGFYTFASVPAIDFNDALDIIIALEPHLS